MRTVTAPAAAALSGNAAAIALLVEMLTTPQAIRLTTAAVALPWAGETYTPGGQVGTVDAVVDEIGGTPRLQFQLCGVPQTSVALALDEATRGVPVRLRLAVLDPATQLLLDAPLIWAGELDVMTVQMGATATITVQGIHRGETYRRPKPLRYTAEDQLKVSAGDTSLRFIISQSQSKDVWPAASFFRQ